MLLGSFPGVTQPQIMSLDESTAAGQIELTSYAKKAYLDYAMSVVLGRALPAVADGQKPVHRRILYDMHKLGLDSKAKPAKCARFVGDVLGRYHPHGDQSVYDASVRMAQDFSLRYPLIDGHGNFGSRDGDGAAAMRYTEARLSAYAELLLSELDMGTVDFVANFDGTTTEPDMLPARLPMLLLNGVSGIAVGMATEIPSHNLREVADACELLIKKPDASLDEVMACIPGPDFPTGAQIISSRDDIAKAYSTGRGPIRLRAIWTVENLARGQWQLVVSALPQGTSTAAVMAEIEELTNPQIKPGKKALTQEQLNLKALFLSVIDRISDDSDDQAPVRLVIEPRSSRQLPDEVIAVLLAHTSMELNFSVNMVALGLNHKPCQKGLIEVLKDWIQFRFETVTRRVTHRNTQVLARMHILEGRLAVYDALDDVIEMIRTSESPKAELMAKFKLSEIQASDVLELRLRQLGKLELATLQREHADLSEEQAFLRGLLDNRSAMTKQILLEIAADKKKFGDDRKTLIEAAERVTTASVVSSSDDPVTIIVSKQGWLRARTGHKLDHSTLTWKPGDSALAIIETRSTAVLAIFDNTGRAYNVAASSAPTGRGDGTPLTSLIDMGGQLPSHVLALNTSALYLLATSASLGFLCKGADLLVRQKAGKVVVSGMEKEDVLLAPVELAESCQQNGGDIVVGTSAGKLLLFQLAELKVMPKAKGMQLMTVNGKDKLCLAQAFNLPVEALTVNVRGTASPTELAGTVLANHRAKRARAGAYLLGKLPAVSVSAKLGHAVSTSVESDEAPSVAAQSEVQPSTPAPPVDFNDADLI